MSERHYTLEHFLRLRGVQTPCEKCKGLGSYCYSSGSTWRGGMGTCAFTYDVCDKCWNTGDKYRIGTDIRAIEASRKNWEAEQCLTYLGQRLGIGLSGMKKRVGQLAELCQKQASKRKLPPGEERNEFWWNQEWTALASILAKLST